MNGDRPEQSTPRVQTERDADALPPSASEASKTRYVLARELAQACPLTLGQAIALTGSAARGEADDTSDIEINFWTEAVPPEGERVAWLQSVGATNLAVDENPLPDGSHWITFLYGGTWVEAGWQTLAALDHTLSAILASDVLNHGRLTMAWTIAHAVAIRDCGIVRTWQERLSHYPDALQPRVIAVNTEVWQLPHAVNGRWTLARRGHQLALTERLLWDVYNVLRVLFALNRQWEPDWKWLNSATRNLDVKPDRLVERIDQIFSTLPPEQRIATCMDLIVETLALLPPTPGILRARETVRESLESHRARS